MRVQLNCNCALACVRVRCFWSLYPSSYGRPIRRSVYIRSVLLMFFLWKGYVISQTLHCTFVNCFTRWLFYYVICKCSFGLIKISTVHPQRSCCVQKYATFLPVDSRQKTQLQRKANRKSDDLSNDDIGDDFQWPFKVTSGTINVFWVNFSNKYNILCITDDANYNYKLYSSLRRSSTCRLRVISQLLTKLWENLRKTPLMVVMHLSTKFGENIFT